MTGAVIVGGGPAGLAAAHELTREGASVVVLERLSALGGLCRTVTHAGCRFDVGPHRFFTRNEEVRRLFAALVGEDLLRVPRLTRILYRNRLFNYPLTPANAVMGMGVGSCLAVAGSYLRARVARALAPREPRNFEEWVSDRFGARLFEIFFQTYTEKVWGIPCTRIGADWAGQRIKGLSLPAALWNAVRKPRGQTIKTLVDEFWYPRLGAGQFYEQMAAAVTARGGAVLTDRQVIGFRREGERVRSCLVREAGGETRELEAEWFLSSAPLTEAVLMMDPPPPAEVIAACRALRYRAHLAVNLKVEGQAFPDNWIYVHAKELAMARVADYRNFSPAMADADSVSPLTVEYFAFPGDETWRLPDAELVALAARELARARLADPDRVVSGAVVRSESAYPVVEIGAQAHLDRIKAWVDSLENFIPIGRAGLFRYNNQDHSVMTGLLAARTALGLGRCDPWRVNIEAEYHEEGPAG